MYRQVIIKNNKENSLQDPIKRGEASDHLAGDTLQATLWY